MQASLAKYILLCGLVCVWMYFTQFLEAVCTADKVALDLLLERNRVLNTDIYKFLFLQSFGLWMGGWAPGVFVFRPRCSPGILSLESRKTRVFADIFSLSQLAFVRFLCPLNKFETCFPHQWAFAVCTISNYFPLSLLLHRTT